MGFLRHLQVVGWNAWNRPADTDLCSYSQTSLDELEARCGGPGVFGLQEVKNWTTLAQRQGLVRHAYYGSTEGTAAVAVSNILTPGIRGDYCGAHCVSVVVAVGTNNELESW